MNKSAYKINSFCLHKLLCRLRKQIIKHNIFYTHNDKINVFSSYSWPQIIQLQPTTGSGLGGGSFTHPTILPLYGSLLTTCAHVICALSLWCWLTSTCEQIMSRCLHAFTFTCIDSHLLTLCVCHQRLLTHPGAHLVGPKWGIGSEVSLLRFPNTAETH